MAQLQKPHPEMLNKLHALPFKQVSYPSQRNNSGSAVVYSMYNLHKKSPHLPVFHKTPVIVTFKNCRCGCAFTGGSNSACTRSA